MNESSAQVADLDVMEHPEINNRTNLGTFVIQQYHYAFYDNEDLRFKSLPMMESGIIVFGSMLVYIYLVCYLLPRFMTGRKPFQLRKVLIVYNTFQVILNVWIVYLCIQGGWFNGYSFTCQPSDYSQSPQAMKMVQAIGWYYFAKYLDLLDTVFFNLLKNFGQVTNLHIAHHATMPFFVWYMARFAGVGHWTFLVLINSFIHVVMYTYYLIAALGYKNFLWWKRYLTLMQMVQFVFGTLHQAQTFFNGCPSSLVGKYLVIILGPIIFLFFFNFYMQAYAEKRAKNMSTIAFEQGKNPAIVQK